MIVKYDYLNRYEAPLLTLCNPGSTYQNGIPSKIVGILSGSSAEEMVANFNSTSEYNFRITRIPYADDEDNAHVRTLYDAIKNRRMIFVENIGYFIIDNIEDGNDPEGLAYKDIKAVSCEAEIQNKMVPYIKNDTYQFTDLLESIVSTIPLWKIGYVDEVIATKHRTFEDIGADLNCLAFMLENMQEAYECIFVFDIINRLINVYDQNNYVRKTDIHITKEDLIESINISENSSDLYTALSVFGSDDLTISPINPLGTSVIYRFDYYLSWMPDGLRDKVSDWQHAVANVRQSYYDINLQYYKLLDECSNLDSEIEMLNTQITMYQRCRDNIIAELSTDKVDEYNSVIAEAGGAEIIIYEDIQETLSHIDELISGCNNQKSQVVRELNEKNNRLESLKAQIESVHEQVGFDSYFSESEYEELCNYIFEGSYKDDNIITTESMSYEEKFEQMKTLYDRAEKRLVKVSEPTQEFKIDVDNFAFDKQFEHWSDQLETGCLINVELAENDVAALFLSNITVNYEDCSMSLTFGNRFNKFDTKSLFDNVLGDISKSSNTIDYLKDILYPIRNGGLSNLERQLQTSRDLTMGAALASQNEEVIIDGSGYTGRKLLPNGTYDPRQVKLTGKSIVFTNDAWESCQVALGEIILANRETVYGLNADVIFGRVLLGTNLVIEAQDDDGTTITKIDKDGLSVYNGNISIYSAGGTKIFGTDENGNLFVSGKITSTSGKIGGWEIGNNVLKNGTIGQLGSAFVCTGTTSSYTIGGRTGTGWVFGAGNKFGVTKDGDLFASNANITGTITATSGSFTGTITSTSGKIGGWTIGSNFLRYVNPGEINICLNNTPNEPVIYCTQNSIDDAFFKINRNGTIFAKNANITGTITATSGSFTGTITATSGQVGGWSITNNAIESYKTVNGKLHFVSLWSSYPNTDWNHLFLCRVFDGTTINASYTDYIDMRSDGRFYASNANITGTITATSGSFTGTITANSGVIKNGVYFGSNKTTYINNFTDAGGRLGACWQTSDRCAYVAICSNSSGSGIVEIVADKTLSLIGADTILCQGGSMYFRNNTFALSGGGTTSDITKKHEIVELSDSYNVLFDNLTPVSYKYNDGTSNRNHTGFIAQQVDDAVKKANLSTQNFAAIMIDNQGTEEESWYLRYEEFIALNTWQIQKAKSRIKELEDRVAQLESMINTQHTPE